MSDLKSSYGEPGYEPRQYDDVVGSVNESLADAEAAGRDAVPDSYGPQQPAAERVEPVNSGDDPITPAAEPMPPAAWSASPVADSTDDEITDAAAYTAAYNASQADDEFDRPGGQAAVAARAYDADDTTAAPTQPVGAEPAVGAAAAATPQPIFVQAPEPPRPRGNRAAAGAIGLLAAVSFAILYLGAWLGVGLITDDIQRAGIVDAITAALSSWIFWTPVVLFFLGFWLLGAIINRGRWVHWVIFGVFVGLASWFGYLAGRLIQEPFWMLTPREGIELLQENMFAPLAVLAFIIGRELTIWFGAWAAARGRRVTELNTEAMREYERTLEAGPQLYRA